jgi:two-component system chemotaxis response regulator CheB
MAMPVPIFIVQHMPPIFTKSLADHLNAISALTVVEATHGEFAAPGHVYIAPGGKQMRIRKRAEGLEIIIRDDAPVGGCKPSVDYLLDSVEVHCRRNSLVLILTGMGNDGLSGCRKLSSQGAYILAQSADTCVVYGMPRQIIENQLANEILSIDKIPIRIAELMKVSSCHN